MSDRRWYEIDHDVSMSVRHFSRATGLFLRGGLDRDDEEDRYWAQMGFMHAMMAGHTSLESAVLRVFDFYDEEPPSGETWHYDLIARAARSVGSRPALFNAEQYALVQRTRAFRHVSVRNYNRFDAELAKPAVTAASAVLIFLPTAFATLRRTLEH